MLNWLLVKYLTFYFCFVCDFVEEREKRKRNQEKKEFFFPKITGRNKKINANFFIIKVT